MEHGCEDAMIFELESGDLYCLCCGETFVKSDDVDKSEPSEQ